MNKLGRVRNSIPSVGADHEPGGAQESPWCLGEGVDSDGLFAWSFQGKVSYFLGEKVVSHEAQEAASAPEKESALSPAQRESNPTSSPPPSRWMGSSGQGGLWRELTDALVPSTASGVEQINFFKATIVNF